MPELAVGGAWVDEIDGPLWGEMCDRCVNAIADAATRARRETRIEKKFRTVENVLHAGSKNVNSERLGRYANDNAPIASSFALDLTTR
jgi:hypothetical protein